MDVNVLCGINERSKNEFTFTNASGILTSLKGGVDMAKEKVFGYARVSAKDQNEARQIDDMKKMGIDERDIFIDKQSGKNFDRPQYQALRNTLREGDTLILTSIDRLGRDYDGIMQEWRYITQEIKANIKVLDMPLLDTTAAENSLDGKFVAELVLQILSYVANKERINIRSRQRQGIDAAKMRNVKFGRPALEMPDEFPAVYEEWKANGISAVKAMEKLNVKKTSFYKLVKEYEAAR